MDINYPDLDTYICSDRFSNDVASVNITARELMITCRHAHTHTHTHITQVILAIGSSYGDNNLLPVCKSSHNINEKIPLRSA